MTKTYTPGVLRPDPDVAAFAGLLGLPSQFAAVRDDETGEAACFATVDARDRALAELVAGDRDPSTLKWLPVDAEAGETFEEVGA